MSANVTGPFTKSWAEDTEWTKLKKQNSNNDNQMFKWQTQLLDLVIQKNEEERSRQGDTSDVDETRRKRQLEEWIRELTDVPGSAHAALINMFLDESYRYGVLQPLWDTPGVTDIQVFVPSKNADEQIISYKEYGQRKIYNGPKFRDWDHAREWVNMQLTKIGLRYDPAKVELNGMLPGGERIHIISGPVAYSKHNPRKKSGSYIFSRCMIITVRLFGKGFSLEELTATSMPQHELPYKLMPKKEIDEMYERKPVYTPRRNGIACKATMDYIRIAGELKKSKLIIGGTGSGKTTVFNADTVNIDDNEILLVIEEAPEMQPQIENHVIRLYEREGAFTQKDALRSSLRMFPDRIYISEIRDSIAYLFMRALMSGHAGSGSTIHASSCAAGLDQLVELAAGEASAPDRDTIRRIFKEHLGYLMYMNPTDGDRTMRELCEINHDGSLHTVSEYIEGLDDHGTKQGYYKFTGPSERFIEEMLSNSIAIPSSWKWRKLA